MEVGAFGEIGLLVILALEQRRGPGCATTPLQAMEEPRVLAKLLNLNPAQVNTMYDTERFVRVYSKEYNI